MREQAKLLLNVVQLHPSAVRPERSYAKINRNLTLARGKSGIRGILSYQFVSGVTGISDKFEARSLKILLSVRDGARVKAEFP